MGDGEGGASVRGRMGRDGRKGGGCWWPQKDGKEVAAATGEIGEEGRRRWGLGASGREREGGDRG